MHQKYVAVHYYAQITHTQKNTIYSGANLTTVSVCGGIYRVLSHLSIPLKDRHMLVGCQLMSHSCTLKYHLCKRERYTLEQT